MQHIGILAHSAEGATLCYRTTWLEGVARLGPHQHPEITLTGTPMGPTMPLWERGDLAALRDLFAADVRKLAAAGADFFVCPDNTAHIALEAPGEPFAIPGLHIAAVVADKARREGHAKVGILGTEWTMTGPGYPAAFRRTGLAWAIPEASDRKVVHDAIFEELCLGTFTDQTRQAFVGIIEDLKQKGCDSVALVCTEIPLLITQQDSPLPILDSTRLLAKAAVACALGDGPKAAWHGGPMAPG